jgi:hypothetical protein
VVTCSIVEGSFQKWGWLGAPQSTKTIIVELTDSQKKVYSGILKAGEFQRVVTALVSERSRGVAVVHSPNHLAVHVVDAAATSATTTKQDDSEAVMELV